MYRLLIALALAAQLASDRVASAGEVCYYAIDLDRCGRRNELGQHICRRANGEGNTEAYLLDPVDGLIPLGFLGCSSPYSSPDDLNNLGHVCGVSESPTCEAEAFFWTPEDGMIGLGDLPGGLEYSWARAVNDLDQVVGLSWTVVDGKDGHEAFLWTREQGMVGLGDLPGGQFVSVAVDINNLGWIVGWSCDDVHGCPAVLWTPEDGIVPLPLADASAVNDLGQVVGIKNLRAALWSPWDGTKILGVLHDDPGAASRAEAINNRGQVVGWSRSDIFGTMTEAFLWDERHGMRRLWDLVAASPGDREKLRQGTSINDDGVILASGVMLVPFMLADMDCDGSVNAADLDAFAVCLQHPDDYAVRYPACHGDWAGDLNQDGTLNALDVEPFLACLASGGCPLPTLPDLAVADRRAACERLPDGRFRYTFWIEEVHGGEARHPFTIRVTFGKYPNLEDKTLWVHGLAANEVRPIDVIFVGAPGGGRRLSVEIDDADSIGRVREVTEANNYGWFSFDAD